MKQPNKPALVPGECQLFKQCVNLATNPLNKWKLGGAFSTECTKTIICDYVNGMIHSLRENFAIWTRHRRRNIHFKSNTGYKIESPHYMGVHSGCDLHWQSNRKSFVLNSFNVQQLWMGGQTKIVYNGTKIQTTEFKLKGANISLILDPDKVLSLKNIC